MIGGPDCVGGRQLTGRVQEGFQGEAAREPRDCRPEASACPKNLLSIDARRKDPQPRQTHTGSTISAFTRDVALSCRSHAPGEGRVVPVVGLADEGEGDRCLVSAKGEQLGSSETNNALGSFPVHSVWQVYAEQKEWGESEEGKRQLRLALLLLTSSVVRGGLCLAPLLRLHVKFARLLSTPSSAPPAHPTRPMQ